MVIKDIPVTSEQLRNILQRESIAHNPKNFYERMVVDARYRNLLSMIYGNATCLQITRRDGEIFYLNLEYLTCIDWYIYNYTPLKPILNLEDGLVADYPRSQTQKLGKALLATIREEHLQIEKNFQSMNDFLERECPHGGRRIIEKYQCIYQPTRVVSDKRQPSVMQEFAIVCLEFQGFSVYPAVFDEGLGMKFDKIDMSNMNRRVY